MFGGQRRCEVTRSGSAVGGAAIAKRSLAALACCVLALGALFCAPSGGGPGEDPQGAQGTGQQTVVAVDGQQLALQELLGQSAQVGQGAGKEGKLVALPLPEPERFDAGGGRSGWRLKVPGGRPLATPAVSGGVIYVGGGFGSHEFYALDAETGGPVWTFKTGDDGPTAAAADEGCVAYNTESCTLYVHDAKSGKVLWHRWLGDPLMSHPAIADGRLFMAYPGKDRSHHLAAFELRTGKPVWDCKIAAEVITAPVVDGDSVYAATADGTLYRFGAKDGRAYWSEKCNVTSAPRVAGGKLFISQRVVKKIEIAAGEGKNARKRTSESTVEGFNGVDARTGKLAYKEPQAAIKAAYLLSPGRGRFHVGDNLSNAQFGQVVYQRLASGSYATIDEYKLFSLGPIKAKMKKLAERKIADAPSEGARLADEAMALANEMERVSAARSPKAGGRGDKAAAELRRAAKRIRKVAAKSKDAALTAKDIGDNLGAMRKEAAAAQKQDASVGFASAPAAANLTVAASNIGQTKVKALWAYQGSRPCMVGGKIVSVNGPAFRAVDGRTGEVVWETDIECAEAATRPATPPALAGGKLYLGTADGKIVCADPASGETLWEAKVGGNIVFEPAVVGGRVYAATNDGTLVCLETGDPAADGWAMWGGSARHNGPREK
jgi:outer membrane protein assembly factor BamB